MHGAYLASKPQVWTGRCVKHALLAARAVVVYGCPLLPANLNGGVFRFADGNLSG